MKKLCDLERKCSASIKSFEDAGNNVDWQYEYSAFHHVEIVQATPGFTRHQSTDTCLTSTAVDQTVSGQPSHCCRQNNGCCDAAMIPSLLQTTC
jgi:hypothetical protein